MKNISNQKAYSIFLMIELARCKGIIPKNLEYDDTWAKGWVLSDAFEASKFNVDTKGEYECILDYLKDYKNRISVHATIYAFDKSSNNSILRGIFAKSKEEFNAAIKEFMDEIPYTKYWTEIVIGRELTPEQEEMVSDHEIS